MEAQEIQGKPERKLLPKRKPLYEYLSEDIRDEISKRLPRPLRRIGDILLKQDRILQRRFPLSGELGRIIKELSEGEEGKEVIVKGGSWGEFPSEYQSKTGLQGIYFISRGEETLIFNISGSGRVSATYTLRKRKVSPDRNEPRAETIDTIYFYGTTAEIRTKTSPDIEEPDTDAEIRTKTSPDAEEPDSSDTKEPEEHILILRRKPEDKDKSGDEDKIK